MFCSGIELFVTDIDMCHHFLMWNDVLQHLRKRLVEAVLTASGWVGGKCPRVDTCEQEWEAISMKTGAAGSDIPEV